MTLEWILGLKAGIGQTFAEAEIALNRAKELKECIKPTDKPEIAAEKVKANGTKAVCLYSGSRVYNSPSFDYKARDELIKDVKETYTRVQNYIDMRKYSCSKDTKVSSLLEAVVNDLTTEVNKRCYDQSTGALTPFGHLYMKYKEEREKNKEQDSEELKTFYILLDGNDMHYWNEEKNAGYDDVSKHLNAIGKSLVNNVRNNSKRNVDYVINHPGYVQRTHGSAGDEFLIELKCNEKDILEITKRLIDKAYKAQLGLYKN